MCYIALVRLFRRRLEHMMLIASFVVAAPVVNAQSLNLYNAVTRTLDKYPVLQQRQADVNSATAHLRTVNDHRLPSLILHDQVDAGTANSMIGSYFPMGIVPSTSGAIAAANNTGLASGNIAASLLQWEFCNFGFYGAEQKEARAAQATIEARYSSDKYLLTESVISLYLNWLKKYRLMQILQQNLNRTNTILTAIRANVLSGLKPGLDSSTAAAEYARAHISYIQACADYRNDQVAMAVYTGLDTSVVVPDTTIFAKVNNDNALSFLSPDNVQLNQPLLSVFQKEYEQQLASNDAVAKKYAPKLSMQAAAWMRGSSISNTDTYTPLANGLGYERYNYLFGLTFSWNVMDIRHRNNQLAEGKYKAEAKQWSLQLQQLNLNKLLQQANIAYSNKVQQLTELPVQLRSARQAYVQQLTLYKAGLNTLIEVTNALYALGQAETDYVIAQDELLQLLYLRAGLGNQLDSFLQNFK